MQSDRWTATGKIGPKMARRITSCKHHMAPPRPPVKLASFTGVSLLVCVIALSPNRPVTCGSTGAFSTAHRGDQDLQAALPKPLVGDTNNKLGPLWLYQTVSSSPQDEPNESGSGASNQTVISAKLNEMLTERVGPNVRASSDYHDFQDIRLNETLEAWVLLRKQVASFARDQVHLYAPQLNQIAARANVSQQCLESLEQFLVSAQRLDSWAVQMWSASGSFPPVGLFDGHFTDLGSYRGCVDIRRPTADKSVSKDSISSASITDKAIASSSSSTKSAKRGDERPYAASYCLVGFRPVLPSRRRFHQIFSKEDPSLTSLFEPGDTFHSIANWAQYFHYLYMKTGVCVPAECSASDMQQVARQIGRKLALLPAPVRCFTRANLPGANKASLEPVFGQIDNKPVMVSISKRLTNNQLVSLVLVGAFFSLVAAATLWHFCDLVYGFFSTTCLVSSCSGARGGASCASPSSQDDIHDEETNYKRSLDGNNNNNSSSSKMRESTLGTIDERTYSMQQQQQQDCWPPKYVAFCYFSMITNGREFMDTSVRANEIKCLHGFRVFTMIWIIWVHILQYNDWSGFSRAFESAASLRNPFIHPLINANYVVDNFFLMSGLLAAYTIWYNNKGGSSNFSSFQCFIGRYLRLTPQVLLVSLLYILLPLIGDGPFWYDVTQMAAKECEQNWWINVLHIQSFYKSDQMCNLVGWWISIDMFYYVIGLGLLWMILNKHIRRALICTILLVTYCTFITAWRHYSGGFEPNNLATVPQIGEVWSEFVVKFFWSPYPHAFVFFLGLWLGYVLANEKWYHQIRRWSRLGWFVSVASLMLVNYSSRLWTMGTVELNTDNQALATAYNIICVIIWACAFGWTIVACHYGCAPTLNRLCSTKMNIMLSKASFIIYLSHMLILRAYYGSQYNLIEVSPVTILLMLISLSAISILFGVFLCIAFEGPCLKFQRLILRQIKRERHLPIAGASYSTSLANDLTTVEEKNSLNLGPTSITLLK